MTGKAKIAHGIDGSIGSKFQQYSKYGDMITKSPEELLKMLPNQNNADNSSNNDLLMNIQSGNAEIMKKFDILKSILSNFNDEIVKINFTQEAINAKKTSMSLETIFNNHSSKILLNFKDLVYFI